MYVFFQLFAYTHLCVCVFKVIYFDGVCVRVRVCDIKVNNLKCFFKLQYVSIEPMMSVETAA